MLGKTTNLQRFSLHGAGIGISSTVRHLAAELEHMLGGFRAANWSAGSVPVSGSIWPYEQSHVMRYLSQNAQRVVTNAAGPELEIYEDEERFWLVDDRWGIAEMNLLKGTWRSWVLPNPTIDAVRTLQYAVMWPMAQVLRARGTYLLPASAVTFADRSFLILSPFGLEPELTTLIRGGYRIIGQSWVAVRELEGRLSMLNLPGYVERALPPGMRLSGSSESANTYVDLMKQFCGAEQQQGWCDAVVIVEPTRRPQANSRPLERSDAQRALRAAWPILELHPGRRHGQLAARLAHKVPCYQFSLSREPRDLLRMLASIPASNATNAAIRAPAYRVAG